MKSIASIRVLLLAIPILLVLQIIGWSLLNDQMAIVVILILMQLSFGVFTLWLAYRSQREHSSLASKMRQNKNQQEAQARSMRKKIDQLSQIIELNTSAIRNTSQPSLTHDAHPRELRALDDIGVMRRQLEELRYEMSNTRTDESSANRHVSDTEQ